MLPFLKLTHVILISHWCSCLIFKHLKMFKERCDDNLQQDLTRIVKFCDLVGWKKSTWQRMILTFVNVKILSFRVDSTRNPRYFIFICFLKKFENERSNHFRQRSSYSFILSDLCERVVVWPEPSIDPSGKDFFPIHTCTCSRLKICQKQDTESLRENPHLGPFSHFSSSKSRSPPFNLGPRCWICLGQGKFTGII